ncbi:branched chain amino acid/phenylalanine ABC transporter membrane subunit LivH [Gammaproteobacteria bacterium]
MDILLQQIANGLVLGSLYALVALGYTMVYGILGLINFAHGEVVMVGALTALTVAQVLVDGGATGAWVALAGLSAAVPVCMALGFVIERVAYRPLRHAPRLAPLITAIGVSILLQNLAMLVWGRFYHAFPGVLPNQSHVWWGASLTDVDLLVIGVAALMMGGLWGLIHRTRLGTAMRATAENPLVAQLLGVPIDRVISLTFVIGSGLAAVAGLLVAAKYSVAHYYMGFLLGLKAFTAAVLGGIGNLVGAMVGGLLLGLIESLGAGYIGDLTHGFLGSHYQDIFAFFVLILVLIFRPAGLIGETVADRA